MPGELRRFVRGRFLYFDDIVKAVPGVTCLVLEGHLADGNQVYGCSFRETPLIVEVNPCDEMWRVARAQNPGKEPGYSMWYGIGTDDSDFFMKEVKPRAACHVPGEGTEVQGDRFGEFARELRGLLDRYGV